MNKPPYFAKYLQSCTDSTKTEELLTFFESLNVDEWREFLEDMFLDRTSYPYEIIQPDRGEGLAAYASVFLQDLGLATKKIIGRALDTLFCRYRNHGKKDIREAILKEVIFLMSTLGDGFDASTLIDIMKDEGMTEKIRYRAAAALLDLDNSLPLSFWDKIEIEKNPFLAPIVISAFEQYCNPGKAIETLKRLPKRPSDKGIISFEYPLRMTIRSFLKQDGWRDTFPLMVNSLPQWGRNYLKDKIFTLHEFAGYKLIDCISGGNFNELVFRKIKKAQNSKSLCDLSGITFYDDISFRQFNRDNPLPEISFHQANFKGKVEFINVTCPQKVDFPGRYFVVKPILALLYLCKTLILLEQRF